MSRNNGDQRIDKDKFVLRLPDGMRERIAGHAKDALRSMNAEIIHRLDNSISADDEIRRLRAALDDAQDANRTIREENRALTQELAQTLPKLVAEGATA